MTFERGEGENNSVFHGNPIPLSGGLGFGSGVCGSLCGGFLVYFSAICAKEWVVWTWLFLGFGPVSMASIYSSVVKSSAYGRCWSHFDAMLLMVAEAYAVGSLRIHCKVEVFSCLEGATEKEQAFSWILVAVAFPTTVRSMEEAFLPTLDLGLVSQWGEEWRVM